MLNTWGFYSGFDDRMGFVEIYGALMMDMKLVM